MTNYRKATVLNLLVGIVLFLLGMSGTVAVASTDFVDANLLSEMVSLSACVLVRGYEMGKYA